MLTASAVALMIDLRNVGSPLELAPGSGCRFAPRLRWRLWLRPARGVFTTCNMRSLITVNSINIFLGVSSSIRPCVHSSVFSFHSSSCCLPCCFQQSTRVLRSRLAKRCYFVSADRHKKGQLFLCSSKSFWSTFTRSQASSNCFVCLAELRGDLCHR